MVTAKFVSERKTSEIAEAMEVEMEREMTSKDTSEEPYAHSHAPTLPRADLAVDKGTGWYSIDFCLFLESIKCIIFMLICYNS